jgi:DNA mismatch endonuclease (patch repair protein)
MARVRQKDTDLEQVVRSHLHKRGLRFRKHVGSLPGRPDVVFTRARLAVFIDGDFWHGYDFETRKNDMAPYWQAKIAGNIERDNRNFSRLQAMGWRVLRVWQHEIRHDTEAVIDRIVATYRGLDGS